MKGCSKKCLIDARIRTSLIVILYRNNVKLSSYKLTLFTAFCGVLLYPVLWIIIPERR